MTVRCRKIISAPLRPSRPQHDLPHRLAPLEHRKAFAPVGEFERGVDVRPDPARRRQRVDRRDILGAALGKAPPIFARAHRSEEHTSELQSLMRISYAVFCLKKKK